LIAWISPAPRPNPPAFPSPARATADPTGGFSSSCPLTARIESRRLSASSRRGDIRHTRALSGSASNAALSNFESSR
jgi:hypothetical protein